jgi:hypothetical protein
MVAPDSTLAAGLGGYTRTFMRHHLWRAVRLGLVLQGKPYAVHRYPRPRTNQQPAWGTLADFVGQPFGYYSRHVALSPGVRVAGARQYGGICLHVELADGHTTMTQHKDETEWFHLIDLTVNPRAGTLVVATQRPTTSESLKIGISEFVVSSHGVPLCIRKRCWEPSHLGSPGETTLLALRASPGGSRLYALMQDPECSPPPGEVGPWGRWAITALAEASLEQECCWEAPRFASSLAVTDVGHLVVVSRDGSEGVARVYTPVGEALQVVMSWRTPAYRWSESALYDSDTGRFLINCVTLTRKQDRSQTGTESEMVLAVWE